MKKGAVWLLLGVIIGGVYANALGNGFVFDDYLIVLANPALPRVAENPWLAFSLQTLGYRPFRTLSYVLDFAVGGMNPWLFHFNNIVYHWLTACLVFLVAQRLVTHAEDDSRQLSSTASADLGLRTPNSGLWVALCTTLLWAIHPIQTDVVAYISGRRDILATLFFFLGFYAFLVVRAEGQTMKKSRQIGWFLLLGFSYGLGMLSKEMAVTLPLVMFCYDYVHAVRLRAGQSWKDYGGALVRGVGQVVRDHYWLYVPLLIGGAILSWYYIMVWRPSKGLGWYGGSIVNNFLTVARIWVYYLYLLVYPVKLIADYTGFFAATQSIREWPALAALGFLLGVFLLTLVTLPRSRLVAFASLWFAITLLPVSHIIPHHELLAEHYLYLPSFSFCLLVALGLARLTVGAKRKVQSAKGKEETDGPVLESHAPRATPHVPRPWRLAVAYGLVGILLVGYGWRTVVRNRDWRDELIFYTRLVEDNSCSARARLGLGSIYERLNLPRMAITHYHIGLKCNPDDPRLYLNLGTSYQTLGMLKEAEFAYMATLKIVPNESRALSNLGFLYTELRQYDKARDALERAERLSRGRDAVVYANFGLFYEAQGDLPQALQAYEKATRLDPQNATFLQKKESMKKRLESQAPGQKTETSNASSSTPPH